MKRHVLFKITLTIACAFTIVSASSSTSHAQGVVPSIWQFFFGPPHAGYYYSPYGGRVTYGYRPAYRPVVSFYGPASYGNCATQCSPCGVPACYSPCGATGACGVNYGTANGQEQAANPEPMPDPTFTNDDSETDGDGRKSEDGSTNSEGDEDGFKSRRSGDDADGPQGIEAFKQPATGNDDGSVIDDKQPAPAKGDDDTSGAGGGNNEEGNTDKKAAARRPLRIRPLNLDDKIAWRAVPQRTRLSVRASFSSPKIARTIVKPNSQWLPVPADQKIVQK